MDGREITESESVKRKKHGYDHLGHDWADWSGVDIDLLEYILKKLDLPDILRCRAVCSSWRLITKTYLSSSRISLSTGPPPLFVYYYSNYNIRRYFLDHVTGEGESFYQLNHRHSEKLHTQVSDCLGYSNGWFLFLDKPENKYNRKKRICLFHPWLFSDSPVCFPLISAPPRRGYGIGIQKAALCGNPIFGSSSAALVIIHGNYKKLLFAKCGDTKFTQLEHQSKHAKPSTFDKDIICVNNCIYGFTFTDEGRRHRIESWDCNTGRQPPRKILDLELKFDNGLKDRDPTKRTTIHLVEAAGELLLVSFELFRRGMKSPKYHGWAFGGGPHSCRVYKMDFKEKEWVEIDTLGDWIIFVMDYQTMFLPSHKFPQYEKNSIYFKRDRVGYRDSLKVFNMETRQHSSMHIKGVSYF